LNIRLTFKLKTIMKLLIRFKPKIKLIIMNNLKERV